MIYMKIDKKKVSSFQNKILSFYQENKRDLPWRKTTNPYPILLSEIMLQQTQVSRGLQYYQRWTKKWPTIKDLANAKRSDVLKEWMGLGYNSRAINLHKTAQIITQQYNQDIIKALEHFKELPGIGPYTAQAVTIFSTNKDEVTVDTNVRRILIHEFDLQESVSDKELWELAEKCLPKGKSRDWHNALMDYGATFLTARKTGIKPKTQQSKFEGSDRQIRAKIVRFLLREKADVEQIEKEVHPQRALDNSQTDRIKAILDKLQKEKIIEKKGAQYSINE